MPGGRRSADSASKMASKPASYEEAMLHKELLRNDLSDQDRQQIKTSLARKIYQKSIVMYERNSPPDLKPLLPNPSSSKTSSPPKIVLSSNSQNRLSPSPAAGQRGRNSVDVLAPSPRAQRKASPSPRTGGTVTVIVSPASQRRDVVSRFFVNFRS